MKKLNILKVLGFFVKAVVTIILVAFILTILLQRFSDNKFSFFNYRIFSVQTGSMEPKYNIGDVLISKEVTPESIKKGDPISYLGTQSSVKDKVITHEVVGIENNDDGTLSFRAKGLTNLAEDPIVHEDQLYGKVVYKSIVLSSVYKIVNTPLGMYLLIFLPIMALIGYEIISRLLEKEDEKRSGQSVKYDF